jgi:hypothetical protein
MVKIWADFFRHVLRQGEIWDDDLGNVFSLCPSMGYFVGNT